MIAQAITHPQEAADSVEERTRVLIIDDDRDQVEVLACRLEQQGFEVLTAHRGWDGLERVRYRHPDLVLLDLRLPDLDGFQVCRALSDHPETCLIPVIVVSGMEEGDVVRATREAGCRFFLRKPYDPNVLLMLISQSLTHTD